MPRPWPLLAGLAATLGAWSLAAPLVAQPTAVTILHIGDTRSHLASGGPKDERLTGTLGGLARAATLLRLVRSVDENVVLLHAGDLAGGDLSWDAFGGVPELQLLRALGLDALAVGGRELDGGVKALGGLLSSMNQGRERFAMLSANLDTSACAGPSCDPLQWIEPSQIVERAGVRIGVLALTSPDEPIAPPASLALLGRADPEWIRTRAYETAAALRLQGAQVVVLLSRLGRETDLALAAGQPRPLIDVVVEGLGEEVLHQPLTVAGPQGHETHVVAAGARYEHVGRLRLTVDGPRVTLEEYALFTVGSWVEPEPTVELLLKALEGQITARLGEDAFGTVVGRAAHDLDARVEPAQQARDSALGNLVSDAYRWKAEADVGLTANGLLGDRLARGALVGADLYRVVGHAWGGPKREASPLLRLEMTGAQLVAAIEGTLTRLDGSAATLLQASGLRYEYDSRRPVGRRLEPGSVRVGGEAIEPTLTYTVAMGAALARLLQPMVGLDVERAEEPRASEYEALRDYVKRAGTLESRQEGRILDLGVEPVPVADAAADGPDSR